MRQAAGCWLFAIFCLLVAGCGTDAPADWQWWTAADSAAVRDTLAAWRGTLDAHEALSDTLRLNLSVRLTAADSTSASGDPLYKFARLLAVWSVPAESGHADEYRFGVTVDTMVLQGRPMTDTFCQVAYRDTLARTRTYFLYDSLWVVSFFPETLPDTSVVYRVAGVERRGFATSQTSSKTHDWAARREVFLPKDSAGPYRVEKLTGFAVSVPTAQDAPGISRVVLNRPGQSDTFFYSPRRDGRGLYNLRPLDRLYTVHQDEQVDLVVTTSTPADTNVDRNRFFVGIEGRKLDITAGARQGAVTFAFSEPGYQHVYLQVLPLSNLFYRDAAFTGTTWALPVRVLPRP
ncbi:hypothetical protein FJY69_00985 [candidate division WOR-3 bacterium]|nr:hypothetical protein [candidate division WOR-3 bacterium]